MRIMFRVLLLLLGLALGSTVAEIGLRVAGWPAPGFYQDGRGPLALHAPGAEGGAYPRNVSGRLRHYDYDVAWLVNSHGFRERQNQPKSPHEWRIGLLGDSFAAGVGVEQHTRFGDVWYTAIHKQLPNVIMWDLAAPLCGTACEAAILDGVGRQYDLDEIVLAFYGGNDVADNVSWYQSAATPDAGRSTPPVSERIRGWLREHSRLATFTWVHALRGFATFQPPGIYSETSLRNDWPATEQALMGLKEAVGSRPLTIIYLPAIPEWDDAVWRTVQQRYGVSDAGRFVVKQALMAWAQRNAVDFMDATPWLRRCSSAKECTFPVDSHWNARGHLLVGEGLVAHWTRGAH